MPIFFFLAFPLFAHAWQVCGNTLERIFFIYAPHDYAINTLSEMQLPTVTPMNLQLC